MRSPIFFLFFGKKVRVTRPTLYHEPTIKAPNIGYIKFSLPLLTGPPEIIGMWGAVETPVEQIHANFCLINQTLFQSYGKDYAQYIDFYPPTFLTIRWPWLKESSLWVLRSDKFEFGFDSITHHRSTTSPAGPNRDVGTGLNHVLLCIKEKSVRSKDIVPNKIVDTMATQTSRYVANKYILDYQKNVRITNPLQPGMCRRILWMTQYLIVKMVNFVNWGVWNSLHFIVK